MSAPHRLPRTAALSAVVLLMASSAHAAGGGELPASEHLLVVSGPLLLASWFATTRRLAALPMVGLVVGAQWLLHSAFGALAQGAAAGAHAHGAVDPAAAGAHTPTPSMAVAHTVAALLVALWLAAGERLLWVLVEWLVFRPLALARAVAAPVAAASQRCSAVRLDPLVERLLTACVSWRGPPAAAGTA